jgi:hypothetical protein
MTHDEEVAYHRTFLLFDSSKHLCKMGCHGTKGTGNRIWVDYPAFEPQFVGGQNGKLQPFPGPTTDLRRRGLEDPNTYKQYQAMQMKGQGAKEITIVPKMAQDFSLHATTWEKGWSSLVTKGSGKFTPIVDEYYTVIGHIGTVSEYSLLVPADISVFYESLRDILENHPDITVLLLETPGAHVPEGWRTIRHDRSWYNHTVVVGIDGEVIEQTNSESTNGVAISVDGPLDYLTLGAIAGKLFGKIGIGIVRGLGRSLSRLGGRLVAKAMAKKGAKTVAKVIEFVKGHQKAMGIPSKHFDAIAAAAKETDMILVFRSNKQAAVGLIEKGAPGKPFFFKFKSDPQSGILTARVKDDFDVVFKNGYYVVADGKSAYRVVMKGGKEVTETIPIKNPFWEMKPGQVIDPKLHKPVVGDYDMLGAIPMKSKGRNISVVPKDPKGNWSGPDVEKAAKAVNKRLDQPRVLHGAQDQSKMGLSDDAAYAVYPDGKVVMMQGKADQEAFYASIGRQTGAGSYPKPSGPVVDELAKRRQAP